MRERALWRVPVGKPRQPAPGSGRHRKADPAPHRQDRLIRCRDLAGQRAEIKLFTDRGRVVLVVPAGETAVLTAPEVGRLRAALRDVVIEASAST